MFMEMEKNTPLIKVFLAFTLSFCMFFTGSCTVMQVDREVSPVYVTWENDPTNTATICWIQHEKGKPTVLLRKKGMTDWSTFDAIKENIPGSQAYHFQSAISDLESGKTYEFLIPSTQQVYHFSTMPDKLESELSFIIGGDISVTSTASKMNQYVGERQPDFVVWGGDIAYADGRLSRSGRFIQFWNEWYVHSTVNGRILPVISAIGNHEVRGGYGGSIDQAPFFYLFFPHPDNSGYRAVDLGNYLSILLLDTDHTNEIAGAQTRWLEEALNERKDFTHLIPVYHVPAYPSHRNFNGRRSADVREHWTPLFDKNKIPIVFEHHDHTFKRTVPIKNGKAHPEGTVYLGDGAWGVSTRRVHAQEDTWFLEKASPTNHFFEVKLFPDRIDIQAIDDENAVFDEINRPARSMSQ